eukprot:TRINITY_DN2_c0_g3_i1.p1 TRINITY_DN2_c0_g3~~TRINITY_DN2_c0_g3_i1.p1  ORF type:complete len:289 (-),score=69.94 TRINITY_DN2_c0_g3_i1:99-965(-)
MDPSKIPVWTQSQLQTRWRQTPQDASLVGTFRDGSPTFSLDYYIPADVQCDHCILHWYWQSLNSWQNGDALSIGTTSGERFWNCADIAITNPNGRNRGILSGFLGNFSSSSTGGSPSLPSTSTVPISPPTFTSICGNVMYGSPVDSWWIAIFAPPQYQLSVKCNNGGQQRTCQYDSQWQRFTCDLNQNSAGECKTPHQAVMTYNGVVTSCILNQNQVSSAENEPTVGPSGSDDQSSSDPPSSDPSSGFDDPSSTPGWAIALLVLASVILTSLLVVVVVVFTSSSSERV